MNKLQLSVDGISTTPLSIGFEGEQNHTQITFYWTSLFNKYPDAVATMVIKPPTGDPYPKTVTQEDNRVVWDVTASDTTTPGNGSYQLTFTDGEEIIKTYIGAYNVMESLTGNGEAPTPVEDWVTEANAVLAEFESDIAKINDKQDAPETAGTAGQVLGLNNSLEPVWMDQSGGTANVGIANVADYGAIGDGITDDSQAIQDAVDENYNVYFESNKTYYIPTPINIDHDIHLYGGENTVIKTKTANGQLNDVFVVSGTLKKTTTMTTDYTQNGSTANSGNEFTLSDMTGINIGDLMVITATDQYYNYSRQYYYLGGTLLIGDIYDGHLFTTCGLPFDIENTENVSVTIYDAPVAIIENLHFVGEYSGRGHYKQMVNLVNCKNSIVRNCTLTQMDIGITVKNCVNTLVGCVEMSKAKETNVETGDSYGVMIFSSTGTIVERVNAICGQSCVCLTGQITCLNTYVRNCELSAESRGNAIGSHENSYNTVIEDCTLSGLNVLGTAYVSRCRFIKNNRANYDSAITFCGSHNPDYAILKVKDCVFDGVRQIYLYSSTPQNPVQSYDSVIGLVEVVDCYGGTLVFSGTVSETILSNSIKEMNLIRWKNCKEFYRASTADVIEKLTVSDCTFTQNKWVNDHNGDHGVVLTNIYDLDFSSSIPMQHKKTADKTVYAEKYTLPGNTTINLSATNSTTAKYIICGNNLAPNNPNDYVVGTVSGSDGGTLTRTPATGTIPTITNDSNGNIVYTQPNNTSKYNMYPVGLFYVGEYSKVKMSATMKNTGATSAASFTPYIAVVDCSTGKLVSRYAGSAVAATAEGATISYERTVSGNCVAMCYYYCSTAVANSATTFENLLAYVENAFAPSTADNILPYTAIRRTGDGAVLSMAGVNNIMSSETNFHVSFAADFVDNPVGLLPNGAGVNF